MKQLLPKETDRSEGGIIPLNSSSPYQHNLEIIFKNLLQVQLENFYTKRKRKFDKTFYTLITVDKFENDKERNRA